MCEKVRAKHISFASAQEPGGRGGLQQEVCTERESAGVAFLRPVEAAGGLGPSACTSPGLLGTGVREWALFLEI